MLPAQPVITAKTTPCCCADTSNTSPHIRDAAASVVEMTVTVCMAVQAMRLPTMVVRIRNHGQQSNSCNTQQQHCKLSPARKGLGDVSPAAAAAAVARIRRAQLIDTGQQQLMR
jgi:Na+-transporting NADH:ubiquinone oxidoreductase subunit NqrB